MKLKTFRKKLAFKKETISNLNISQMKNVYGYGTEPPHKETDILPYCTYTCVYTPCCLTNYPSCDPCQSNPC